ncbi:MAG: DEAD/DEAH box helicase [Brevundimonas sp.]|uniref:DEAD/DEAH box helicase n=1 Tax=Brevundimonas sp. TaxID=1871086 RepID=UPI0025BCA83F|nr:DEAD/DEAH box helicase [Brevundimonas sp.]MBX3476514.1 DEAD/DEAH box helicase [Brevundimonas sp.]
MPFPPCHPSLDHALAGRGYETPTPVQSAVLGQEAAGRDLLVSAQTGSGKTVAFGLAAAPTLLGEAERFDKADAPLALVIAPTRELALQVATELTWLYAETGARVVTCVGGMDARKEARTLNFGAHIVVGTPGRLRDHIERGNLDLTAIRAVVLDEADEMLDMGFKEDLEFILETTPAERRTLMFSATLAREIVTLARTYQRDALRIDATSKDTPHGDIEYRAMRIAPTDMERAVVNVLRYFESPGAIVFCNTREAVNHLHAALRERGFSVVGLSGELSQRERSDALQALRDGHARVCVATDVAARGLDLPDLGLVIHAQTPINQAGLLHRSGRTGRAGKKGVSVLLVSYARRRKVERMLAEARLDAVWSGPPSAEEIREKDRARLLDGLTAVEQFSDEETALARDLLARRPAEEIAALLIRARKAGMPEPEEVYDDERMKRDQVRTKDEPFIDFARDADCDWFRINLGREKNADPKWLLPLICRLGHVTKRDIGAIRIFERDTKFEITRSAVERFTQAIQAPAEDGVKIEPTVAPAPRERTAPPRGNRPPFKMRRDDKPEGDRKPFKPRDGGGEDRPWSKKPRRDDGPARADGDKPWSKGPRGPKPDGDKPWAKKAPGPKAAGDKPWVKKAGPNKGKPKFKAKKQG